MLTPRPLAPAAPVAAGDAARVQQIVRALASLFGNGEIVAWALVTESAAVVSSRPEQGEPTLQVGPVVDPTAVVRRLARAKRGGR